MTAISTATYESAEDQFVGAAQTLMAAQLDTAKNPSPAKTLISAMSFNSATNILSITAAIPCVATIGSDGNLRIDASESFL